MRVETTTISDDQIAAAAGACDKAGDPHRLLLLLDVDGVRRIHTLAAMVELIPRSAFHRLKALERAGLVEGDTGEPARTRRYRRTSRGDRLAEGVARLIG